MKFPLADMDKWIKQSQVRLDAVVKQSAQDLVNTAQTPRAKGGNMPVVTSFLRNSLMGSTSGMPSGSSSPGNEQQITLTIFRAKPGDTIYLGYVANYARHMERRYAFVRLAAQQWQDIVTRNANKLRGMRDGN